MSFTPATEQSIMAARIQFNIDAKIALLAAPELPHGVRDMRSTPIRERSFCLSFQSIAKSLGIAYVESYLAPCLWDRPTPTARLVNGTPEQTAAFLAGEIVAGLACLEA